MVKIKFSEEFNTQAAVLKVIGVGGGGGNAVNRMIQSNVKNVEFLAANTDAQWLRHKALAPIRLQLGAQKTKGLGAGGDPEMGRLSAVESEAEIRNYLDGADMAFITAGMGGGTGTGAAPVVAKIAKEMGILTVGVVTRPFQFEGRQRAQQAEAGIDNLRQHTDTLVIIPNDRIFSVIKGEPPWEDCFVIVDDVLRKAVQSISDVITRPQEINMDFANVKALMANAGEALMGIGEARGANRAIAAAQEAMESPLLENISIDGAKGLLVNITGRERDVKMTEVKDAMEYIYSRVAEDARVFAGLGSEENLQETIRITVIATGFPSVKKAALAPARADARSGHARRTFPERRVAAEAPEAAAAADPEDRMEQIKKPAFMRRKPSRLN